MKKITYVSIAPALLDPRFQICCTRAAVIIYLLILVIGSIPGARRGLGDYASGEALHSIAYAGLTVLLFLGRAKTLDERTISAVAVAAAMGAGDELVQSFLPYRHADVLDWAIDITASVLAATVMLAVYPRVTGRCARRPSSRHEGGRRAASPVQEEGKGAASTAAAVMSSEALAVSATLINRGGDRKTSKNPDGPVEDKTRDRLPVKRLR